MIEEIFRASQRTISDVQREEHRWFRQGDPESHTLPWMPFQPSEFMSIVFECVPEMKGDLFLDVGCGPGTKMKLARDFFGMEAHGLEIDPAMGASAMEGFGSRVHITDALAAPAGFYGGFSLIWLYRPFRDPDKEAILEARITDEMKPGAILAGGSWELEPSRLRWVPVVDDWEIRRGAWMKPGR